ncbi:hypothetical protein DOTSEDRAFT_40102 [Dothistroma septosporum NZE10]|uniref:Uncharacterized protein n=1 Tax=Dothistroma septosporum (strain NZE10 / CBS 128990) TaxID=675120 RepID=N1Q0L5_DOTSN|nr:hypothetical protein DOTSEDRAFT_40102 [Dothistroma septosporum NZE10]
MGLSPRSPLAAPIESQFVIYNVAVFLVDGFLAMRLSYHLAAFHRHHEARRRHRSALLPTRPEVLVFDPTGK